MTEPTLMKLDVVIVEDSKTQAYLLEQALLARGHAVRVAQDGRLGLAAVRDLLPDLVISDVVMPNMDGFAMCAAIKGDERLRHVPVILLTALSSPEDVLLALESEADGFVLKPLDEEVLFSTIARTLAAGDLKEDEFHFAGKSHVIGADRHRILGLFCSVYDAVTTKNQDLLDARRALEVAAEEARLRGAELAAANEELKAFTHSVSHDLRAPLRAITGFSEILAEEEARNMSQEGHRLLGVVRTQAAGMATLIDDLLELSRVGRSRLERGRCDMEALVAGVVGELENQFPDPTRTIDVGPLPPAAGDSSLIHQVWVNLLSNAVKFSARSQPPRIQVRGSVGGNESTYWVTDNGAGFAMEYAQKLFGIFERLHRQEEYGGTGVGLSIVKRIVERHGGRVWAEGEVGEGATFSFALPSWEDPV